MVYGQFTADGSAHILPGLIAPDVTFLILNSSWRMNLMAAGDGNRVWFPEMIEMLRRRWNAAMPFPALIDLCNILDDMFQHGGPEANLATGFSLSQMWENRGFRESATTQHQCSGNYSVIGSIRYRLVGSDQAD